jgi:ATP-binding cassette subfamily B protein
MIQRGAVSLGRVNEILNTLPSIKDSENPSCVQPSADIPALELSGLKFSYNDTNTVLDGITLTINRGEWLGIMGRTGSGKTTLIKTFTRMADPPCGAVRVFGVDVRGLPLEELRRLFAVSPQDSYLFSDSIANNISYGYDGADSASTAGAVEKAVVFASLDKDLALFQNGKDTLVGERGLTLSGGQKQRTAIARAVIMDSEFLILDDSLSAVDNETERKILEALRQERKDRTTIIISHRVSTLKYADKVLVLDKGKTAEYGSPGQLAAQGGFYSRMAAFQKLDTQTETHNV